MKLLKLSILPSLLLSSIFIISSCTKYEVESVLLANAATLNAQKEVPANTSTATGNIDYNYNKATRTLTYSINWKDLTGPVAAMHIHGLADPGFNANFLQNIITTSNGINTPAPRFGASGSLSATLFFDGQIFKEEHLLAGKYYINIHTATYPGGEIRAQIIFP